VRGTRAKRAPPPHPCPGVSRRLHDVVARHRMDYATIRALVRLLHSINTTKKKAKLFFLMLDFCEKKSLLIFIHATMNEELDSPPIMLLALQLYQRQCCHRMTRSAARWRRATTQPTISVKTDITQGEQQSSLTSVLLLLRTHTDAATTHCTHIPSIATAWAIVRDRLRHSPDLIFVVTVHHHTRM